VQRVRVDLAEEQGPEVGQVDRHRIEHAAQHPAAADRARTFEVWRQSYDFRIFYNNAKRVVAG
jgi:hypothetical protein